MCIHLEYRNMISVSSKAPWAQYKRTAIFFHNATLNSADVDLRSWSKINFQWSFAFDLCRIRILPVILSIYPFWQPLRGFCFCFCFFPSHQLIHTLVLARRQQHNKISQYTSSISKPFVNWISNTVWRCLSTALSKSHPVAIVPRNCNCILHPSVLRI